MEKRNLTLLTDLYELTMMNGYYLKGMTDEVAVFDVFFRRKELITYSLAAGLDGFERRESESRPGARRAQS